VGKFLQDLDIMSIQNPAPDAPPDRIIRPDETVARRDKFNIHTEHSLIGINYMSGIPGVNRASAPGVNRHSVPIVKPVRSDKLDLNLDNFLLPQGLVLPEQINAQGLIRKEPSVPRRRRNKARLAREDRFLASCGHLLSDRTKRTLES